MFAPRYFAPTYFAPRYFPPGSEAADVGNFRNWDTDQGKAPQSPIVNVIARPVAVDPLRHAANYQLTPVADAVTQQLVGDVRGLICPGVELPTADGRPLFATAAIRHTGSWEVVAQAAARAEYDVKLAASLSSKLEVAPQAAARPKKLKKMEAMAADTGVFTAKGYHNLTDEQIIQVVRSRRRRRKS